MKNLFSTEGKIYYGMTKIYQLVILNIIFLVLCVPIITMGAAITALYGTTFKMIKDEEKNVSQTFFIIFKKEFQSGTKIWLIYLGLLALFIFSYSFLRTLFSQNIIFFYFFMLLISLGILTTIYVFPVLSIFDNRIMNTFKNSFFLAIKHAPQSILLFLIALFLLVIVPIYFEKLFFLWLTVGYSLTVYISAHIFRFIFEKYIIIDEEV
ncbi:YesL family protein [Desemzia sp. FAM 23991]|uniref:YesL family protein n=1 Tax=unclassified Desemzia TaxID=2685243 RepID=UPI0038870E2F